MRIRSWRWEGPLRQGEVLAVGPGCRNEAGDVIPLQVKVGDRVFFGKYSGQPVKVDSGELLVLRERDVSPDPTAGLLGVGALERRSVPHGQFRR